MTKELAQLLDGPVTERFGRPTNDSGRPLVRHKDGEWCWFLGHEFFELDNGDGSMEWLAHLLGVCGERKINHTVDNNDTKPNVLLIIRRDSCFGACGGTGDTLLEALARAMLAVPEKP